MKFIIKQSPTNHQWRAYFVSDNRKVIFWAEQYQKIGGALHAITLIDPTRYFPIEVINANGEKEEFRLAEPNGESKE